MSLMKRMKLFNDASFQVDFFNLIITYFGLFVLIQLVDKVEGRSSANIVGIIAIALTAVLSRLIARKHFN